MRDERYFRFLCYHKGRVTTNKRLKFVAKIQDTGYVENLYIEFYRADKLAMEIKLNYVGKENKCSIFASKEFDFELSGTYYYVFRYELEGSRVYIVKGRNLVKEKGLYPNEFGFKLEVPDKTLRVIPKWLGRTVYQLMPDRFSIGKEGINQVNNRKVKNWEDRMPDWEPDTDGVYRNEYFYGGNLQGIMERIQYIKSMGFDTVYITPIYPSKTYHHYDPCELLEIDPMLGTWEDFKNLALELKKNGMYMINDCVFNHMSNCSELFKSAVSDKNSPYKNWFAKDGDNYRTWYGFKDMIELDKMNKDVQEYHKKSIKKLKENGADAIRLDLGEILPSGYLTSIGEEKDNEFIFFNEMWGLATHRYDSQIFNKEADSVMNYPATDAILRWVRYGNAELLKYILEELNKYPKEVRNRLLNIVSTHDTPTAITMLIGEGMNPDSYTGGIWDIEAPWRKPEGFNTYGFRKFEAENDSIPKEKLHLGIKKLKLALGIFYVIPGIPSVFMGTENAESGYKDPFPRKPMIFRDTAILKNFLFNLSQVRKENLNVLAQGDARVRRCNDSLLDYERYTEKNSFRAIYNRTNRPILLENLGADYKLIFSEEFKAGIIGANQFAYFIK